MQMFDRVCDDIYYSICVLIYTAMPVSPTLCGADAPVMLAAVVLLGVVLISQVSADRPDTDPS